MANEFNEGKTSISEPNATIGYIQGGDRKKWLKEVAVLITKQVILCNLISH